MRWSAILNWGRRNVTRRQLRAGSRERVMKKLLFGTVITMIVVSPVLGGMGDYLSSGSCKGCPSWRSPASSNLPPVMGKTSAAYPYGPLEFKDPYGGPLQGERADPSPPRTKRNVHKW